MKGYNEKLDADQQVTAEERIASLIREAVEQAEDSRGQHDYQLTDEDCGTLGRLILLDVLAEFRPDLIEEKS